MPVKVKACSRPCAKLVAVMVSFALAFAGIPAFAYGADGECDARSSRMVTGPLRLLVALEDEALIRDADEVLGQLDDAVLLEFDDASEFVQAQDYYGRVAAFSVVDSELGAIGEDAAAGNLEQDVGERLELTGKNNPLAAAQGGGAEYAAKTEGIPTVALIDTGAPAGDSSVKAVSVLSKDPFDDNGHGSEMLAVFRAMNPRANVLSIKALNAEGVGSVSSLYAAIECAIKAGADVVNLSLSAPATEYNAAIESAVQDALEAGVVVVAAAGNNAEDAQGYVPGGIAGVLTVGALGADGVRLASSNYGSCVDAYVCAESTSQAAAMMSAWISAHLDEDWRTLMNEAFPRQANPALELPGRMGEISEFEDRAREHHDFAEEVKRLSELYAGREDSYTITFDSCGGVGDMPDLAARYVYCDAASLALPRCGFAKQGFSFAGWYATPDPQTGATAVLVPDGQVLENLCYEVHGEGGPHLITLLDYADDNDVIALKAVWRDSTTGELVGADDVTEDGEPFERFRVAASAVALYRWTNGSATFLGIDTAPSGFSGKKRVGGTYNAAVSGTTTHMDCAVSKSGTNYMYCDRNYNELASVKTTLGFKDYNAGDFKAIANGGSSTKLNRFRKETGDEAISTYHYWGVETSKSGWIYEPDAHTKIYLIDYKVRYKANGGSGAPSAQTKAWGTNLVLSSTVPVRASTTEEFEVTYDACGGVALRESDTVTKTTDYAFASWNTASDGSGTRYKSGGTYKAEENAVLYAQWSASAAIESVSLPDASRSSEQLEAYTVSLDANGGQCEAESLTADRTARFLLLGWFTSPEGDSLAGVAGDQWAPTQTQLYAQWGQELATSAVELPVPTWKGHTFLGWAEQAGATGVSGLYRPDGNVVLHALWESNPRSVAYDANGGEGTMPAEVGTVGVASTVAKCSFTRPGYTFVKWNTASGGDGEAYDSGQPIIADEDVVLFAQWEPVQLAFEVPLEIPFLLDGAGQLGGVSDGVLSIVNSGGVDIALTGLRAADAQGCVLSQDPTEAGQYDFSLRPEGGSAVFASGYRSDEYLTVAHGEEWRVPAMGSVGLSHVEGRFGQPLDFFSGKRRIGTLAWRFSPVSVSVSYEGNGAEGSMPTQRVNAGGLFTVPPCGFINTGYEFAGWKVSSVNGEAVLYPGGEVEATDDMVLSAQWRESR